MMIDGPATMRSGFSAVSICRLASTATACLSAEPAGKRGPGAGRPNILLASSDDQSWPRAPVVVSRPSRLTTGFSGTTINCV